MKKRCSKCRIKKSTDKFSKDRAASTGLQSQCKTCAETYRQTHKAEIAKCVKEHNQTHKVEIAKRHKEYSQLHKIEITKHQKKRRQTIKGNLRARFGLIKQRCTNPKDRYYKNYGGRGIQIKFKSADEFIDYVINVLKIDPRGLVVHRIKNDKHYEKGNIEFLTKAEHNQLHAKMRKKLTG